MDCETAHFTGAKALSCFAVAEAINYVAGENLLANNTVPVAMVDETIAHHGAILADKLLAALRAGLFVGVNAGYFYSAELWVASNRERPIRNLRVYRSGDNLISEVKEVWKHFLPQFDDYITRAINLLTAPS